MKTLLEDYQRKLQTAEQMIKDNTNNGSINDVQRAERLTTKAAEYRSFIVDIERAMKRSEEIQLSDYAKEKLNFINGSGFVRDFPKTQPKMEWVGAVLDLLSELKLNKLIQ